MNFFRKFAANQIRRIMKYYILYNDENRGPLELEELEQYGLNPKSRVWAPGWSNWQDAGDVPEIQEYFAKQESESRRLMEEEKERERQKQQQAELAARSEQEARTARDKAAQDAGGPASAQVPEPAAPTAAPKMETDEIEWYIAVNDQEVGPVKEAELTSLGLTPDTLVWHDNLTSWTPAREVAELNALLASLAVQSSRQSSEAALSAYPAQYPAAASGNSYTAAIVAVIALIATVATVILKGEYYDPSEKAILCAYCAGAPFLLSIGSLIYARRGPQTDDSADNSKKEGISIGMAVGAIASSLAGIMIAINEFSII